MLCLCSPRNGGRQEEAWSHFLETKVGDLGKAIGLHKELRNATKISLGGWHRMDRAAGRGVGTHGGARHHPKTNASLSRVPIILELRGKVVGKKNVTRVLTLSFRDRVLLGNPSWPRPPTSASQMLGHPACVHSSSCTRSSG